MLRNPLLQTDGYKLTHWRQYPKDSEIVYSYLESRGGMFPRTEQIGLTHYLKEYFEGQFFTPQDVVNAAEFSAQYFGNPDLFNSAGWNYIWNRHRGRLPLRIRAIPEGHLVDTHNALVTIENTDPNVPWLTNYVESLLLKLWYPTTVGTLSFNIRQIIGKSLSLTGDPSLLLFKLHDFGYRGVSSEESSEIGGFAHLCNFMGTDTLGGITLAAQHYDHPIAGFSIPASEHSTITSWGGPQHEAEAMENMLDQYPKGLVACVSDSYDLDNAVRNIWGDTLRDKIISRQGTLVIRPDSGDPLPVILRTFETLSERFGSETNQKGYRVLAPCVRVIQGDGVNYHSISQIVKGINDAGWSMDNLAFGMGGALLQQLNRDTQRFAFKCSAIRRAGKWWDVYKDPKTDPSKASKAGRFKVSTASGKFITMRSAAEGVIEHNDMLETVFEDGEIKKQYTLKEIRQRVASYDTF